MRVVIRACDDFGVECLTLYAFSTENWKRPVAEVDFLMKLPMEFFKTEIEELVQRNIRIRFIGDISKLPIATQEVLHKALERTMGNTGMIVNFALNYGGRSDILEAVQKFAQDVERGKASWTQFNEDALSNRLSTSDVPDPDLIIRTSGELRLSNFLIWQATYSELWFTDTLWPDFSQQNLYEAIADYQKRQRRFGGLK